MKETVEVDKKWYLQMKYLGLVPSEERSHNVGASDYAEQIVQPWTFWLAYPHLTPWDHDIIKRICRTKTTDSRRMDYEKIIHICQERIRQIDAMKELEIFNTSIDYLDDKRHG